MIQGAKMAKNSEEIDYSAIIETTRKMFSGKEKGLGLQITTGKDITRPEKDSDFIMYPGEHWKQLTGIKGLPFGYTVQIAGRPDSGKTSHAMQFMAQAQKDGHAVLLWDVEGKFSAKRFDHYIGGDSKKLFAIKNRTILTGGDMVTANAKAFLEAYPKKKMLIVWDSVGGTLSSSEDEKDLRESRQMAMAAKENGMVLRAWTSLMEEYKNKETNEDRLAVLLINQSYANIGSVGQKESGGQKVEYFSSLILQLTRKGDLTRIRDKVKRRIGITSRAKVKKNHLFDGEDTVAEMDLKVLAGVIEPLTEVKDENLIIDSDSDEFILTDENE